MPEKMFESPPPIENKSPDRKKPTQEELDEYADLIAQYENEPKPEGRVECGPMIIELEARIEKFEAAHDLAAMHAIKNLTSEEAPNYPDRESAKEDLKPIVVLLNSLEDETNITKEKLDELKGKYRKLSQAVGMINRGILDHTR